MQIHFAGVLGLSALGVPAVLVLGIMAAGCSAPNPDTSAGRAELAGQKCTVCRVENPADPAACFAICMQRLEDQGAYLKANGHP